MSADAGGQYTFAIVHNSTKHSDHQPDVEWWNVATAPKGPAPKLPNFILTCTQDPLASLTRFAGRPPRILKSLHRATARSKRWHAFLEQEDGDHLGICIRNAPETGNENATFLNQPAIEAMADVMPATLPTELTLSGATDITIITGFCLFSQRAATTEDDGGVKSLVDRGTHLHNPKETIITPASLYETESLYRLAYATAALVRRLDRKVNVVIDFPRLQYYCYLMADYERGEVSSAFLQAWFTAVEERHNELTASMELMLTELFDRAGVGAYATIEHSTGLSAVSEEINDAVVTGHEPSLTEIARKLSASDETWRCALRTTPTQSLSDIVSLSYIVEYARRAITQRKGQVTISLENRSERRALRSAAKVLEQLGLSDRNALIGVYPIERVIGAWRTTDLYYHDPGDRFLDKRGVMLSASDVIKQLYS